MNSKIKNIIPSLFALALCIIFIFIFIKFLYMGGVFTGENTVQDWRANAGLIFGIFISLSVIFRQIKHIYKVLKTSNFKDVNVLNNELKNEVCRGKNISKIDNDSLKDMYIEYKPSIKYIIKIIILSALLYCLLIVAVKNF